MWKIRIETNHFDIGRLIVAPKTTLNRISAPLEEQTTVVIRAQGLKAIREPHPPWYIAWTDMKQPGHLMPMSENERHGKLMKNSWSKSICRLQADQDVVIRFTDINVQQA